VLQWVSLDSPRLPPGVRSESHIIRDANVIQRERLGASVNESCTGSIAADRSAVCREGLWSGRRERKGTSGHSRNRRRREWALTHGTPSYGPNVAVEVTPIKEWLEIEAGVTPFFSRDQNEWDTDLLFKKPWTLSKTAEFMFGVGPEWAHTIKGGRSADSIGGEAALDFMF
jgi:hypothetical protein